MKRILTLVLALLLLALGGCAPAEGEEDAATLHILCTTYPVYLFTTAVVGETEGAEVSLLVSQQVSCLHDYTLTVKDMKAIERADVIVMNGAGLEEFLTDALEQGGAAAVDCSAGLDLLPSLEHEGHEHHDHGEEYDPHCWMDPRLAAQMVDNIAAALSELDAAHRESYASSAASAAEELEALYDRLDEKLYSAATDYRTAHPELSFWPSPGSGFYGMDYPLITFHNGFQYFASALADVRLVRAIEEEEGSTASAREIREIVSLMEEERIPAIFTEVNGPSATAEAIAREIGCKVYSLDMIMSGEGAGLEPYIEAMERNLETILEAFG